jgi:hypothetical protein
MDGRRVRLGLGLAVLFAVSAAALFAVRHPLQLAVPRAAAIAEVRADPSAERALRRLPYDRVSVLPEDPQTVRVTFADGPQVVLEAGVTRHGVVPSLLIAFGRSWRPYGDWIAYEPALLIGLAALFLLTSLVLPLRHPRNLDTLALLWLLVPVVLYVERWFQWATVAAVPGMLLLGVRAARRGLAGAHLEPPATPLYTSLTAGLEAGVRLRLLRMTLLALGFVFVAVGVSSPGAVDVAYAVMEGATRIVHGALPYGHMPGGIFHGDTYPPLSYLLYTPLAALSPVSSTWDSVDLALAAAVLVTLAAAGLLLAAGRRLDGLLAAVRWLSFPPLLIVVSTGTTDVWLALLLVGAVLTARRPGWSSALLAAAGWFKLAPFALLPLWLAPQRGRRWAAAGFGILAVSAATVGSVLALGGSAGLVAMVHAMSFQLDRGPFQSVWGTLGITALQPLPQAGTVTLVVAAAASLHRHPERFTESWRLASLAVAVLISLQLSAAYWAFLYLPWFAALVVLPSAHLGPEMVIERSSVAPERGASVVQAVIPAGRYGLR